MPTSSCHCGAVKLELPHAPETVTDCNCSICHRYGVLWAYYAPAQVRIVPPDAKLDGYRWKDEKITFNRCARCGCLTHWSPVDPALDRMGVNARLLPPDVLATARVRHLDGRDTEDYVD